MRHKIRNINLFLLLVSLSCRIAYSQTVTPSMFLEQLARYTQTISWEDVYLHTDRDMYAAGEDLWFSAYNFDRKTFFPGGESSLVYVELLSPSGNPLLQKRIGLESGSGKGHMLLPDTLSSGKYVIRAYTGWMKNFMPGGAFMKSIEIYNPFKNSVFRNCILNTGTIDKGPGISFYPEGGKLLNGVRSKVVLHYTGQNGKPSEMTGFILNGKLDTIAVIGSDQWGYGSFEFRPEAGETYVAVTPAGETVLPAASERGYGVTLAHEENGSVAITISAAGADTLIKGRKFIFVILNRGNADFLAELTINDIFTRVIVPVSRLHPGVSSVALISDNNVPVFERAFWIPQPMPGNIESTIPVLNRREKADFGNTGSPFSAILSDSKGVSISVVPALFDKGYVSMTDYMGFGTEFGHVPWFCEPGSGRSVTPGLIDMFLITRKSSWIDLNHVIRNTYPKTRYPREKDGHMMPVSIRYRDEGISDSSRFLYMSTKGKVAEFNYAKRDDEGLYNFLLPVDDISRTYIVQPQHADNNMILEILPSFSRTDPGTVSYSEKFDKIHLDLLSGLSFNYQASRIYGSVNRLVPPERKDDPSRNRRFYGYPELEIWLDDYIPLPVMQEVFFELVPGVMFRTVRTGYEIRIINPLTGRAYTEQPLVMIDGVILNDLAVLADLDPELVERIEAVKTPYLVGDLIIQGIVNVITRSGRFSNVSMPDYAAEIPYRVIDPPVRFISPDYTEKAKAESRLPDLRNTLYWNPSFARDKADEAGVFWTSDMPGLYTVIIQGVDKTGKPVSFRGSIEVK